MKNVRKVPPPADAHSIRALVPYASVLIGLYWLKSAWAAILIYHAGMAVYLAMNGSLKIPRLTLADRRLVIPSLATGLAAGPALYLLWPLAKLPGLEMSDALARFGLHGFSFALFAVYYSTLHPVLEEVFWRFDAGPGKMRYTEDLLYAGYHLLVLVFFLRPAFMAAVFVVLASAGIAWRRLAASGGRAAAVLAHAAGDLATVAAAALLAYR